MTKRPLSSAILAFCGFAAASHALALGFGRIPESITFGQPLDLSVPLRLDPGETVSPACLKAEISVGEQRLPAAAVRVNLERTADGSEGTRLRIRSNVVVFEPLVAVNLAVGCNASMSRQFVLFADPPGAGAALAPALSEVALPVPGAADVPPARIEPKSAPAVTAAATTANRTKGSAPTARADAPRKQVQVRAAAAPRTDGMAQRTAPRLTERAQSRLAERAVPRLELEEPDERLQAALLAVAAQDAAAASAAMAASAAQAAASAAEQRLAQLENSLQEMRTEAAAYRVTMEQMRQRAAQAEDQGRWMWVLSLALLLLAAFAVRLGLRLRALQRERQAGWWLAAHAPGVPVADADAAAALATSAAIDTDTELSGESPAARAVAALYIDSPVQPQTPPVVPSVGTPMTPAAAAAAATLRSVVANTHHEPSPTHSSAALTGAATAKEALTRAVSVDELIDLEQQAEFFVVLGEEDAAIDLLMAHLRSTGGISPLPYLKLLEIYRRRQDPEAHERMRKRFNHRFNAVAPDWQTDPDEGRDLQDYPAVLAAVQAAWHAPLDAMAELENLLFRKRSNELFELPAYRDVLALFAVARDLHRSGDAEVDDVDVLLPLLTQHDPGATMPILIFDRLDRSGDASAVVVEDRPTAPIDLDLSEFSAARARLQRGH